MFRYIMPAIAGLSLLNVSIAQPDASKTYSEGSVQETSDTGSNGAIVNDGTMKDGKMTGDHREGNMNSNSTMPMNTIPPTNTNPSTSQDPANLDGVTLPKNGMMEGQNPMAHGK